MISCFHAGKQFEELRYHDGLLVGNHTLIRRLAKNVFRVANSSEQKVIEREIDNYEAKTIRELHYCLDRRVFNKAYHYLYFGSESLIVIADLLKTKLPQYNFRGMLIRSGRPVIVNFSLRTSELDDTEVKEIATILDGALKHRNRDPFLGTSFVHRTDIGVDKVLSIKKVKLPTNFMNIPEY